MPFLSISSAAKATGKHRATIHRYIKNGLLSTTTDNTGHVVIDTSELLRVFGELKNTNDTATILMRQNIAQDNTDDVALLHRLLQESQEREMWLKEQLESEKIEREREREHSRELEKRLLALPEGQIKKTGWLARIFGR
jgi:hypothetical protein